MSPSAAGRVAAIALRTSKNGPMREVVAAEALADRGIVGDLPVTPDRGITFISAEQWREVTAELGLPIPWHTRRANVLVEGLRLAELLGRTICLGQVRVRILRETRPCQLMDCLQPGLLAALRPELRAGVHGRVLIGGAFSVGDTIQSISPDE